MNKIYSSFKGLLLAVFLLQLPSFLLAQPELRTSRANGAYEAGESMNFFVDPIASGEISYKIYYDEKTEPIEEGTVFASSSNSDVAIPFTLNQPGVVFCEVEQFNQKDLVVAAFSPFEITQSEPEPDDFDEFWDGLKEDLANVPMSPDLDEIEETVYATTYRINLRQIDNRKVYGYLSIPKGNGPFPGVLELPAFGDNPISSSDIVAERTGAIYMKIVIHNAPADQSDPNAYEPDIIDDRDQNYFRWAILAGLRSIDYIASRSDWDGENMAVTGVSQGGALSTMVAGLDDRVTLMSIAHPSHHEHSGNANDVASGWPFYLRQATERGFDYEGTLNATRYYDAINFAKRYDGKVMAFISYEDEISLAPGIFAAFNHYKNEKILMHWLDNGHNPNPEEYWNGRYDFWRRHIPSTLSPPWPWPDTEKGYGIDAGNDIETSTNSVVLNGTVEHNELTNPNWDVKWSKVSGPGNVSFVNAGAYLSAATFSEEGTYVLQFMATDDRALEDDQKYWTLMDYITVKVGDVIDPPTTDLAITCPQDIEIDLSVGSTGTVVSWNSPTAETDCDGGANVFQIGGILNNTFQSAGFYTVRYRATDDCDNAETCSFTVKINAAIDPPPPPTGEYCEAEGDVPWQFWIRRVQLEDINNTSVKEGYGDFLDESTKLSAGDRYTIRLTTGYSWESRDSYWKVWIDYNGNGSFENSEAVVTKIQTGPEDGTEDATTSATFAVPTNASDRTTRMRVAMSPDGYPDACGDFDNGEVEDYTVIIEEGDITPTSIDVSCEDNIVATAVLGGNGINVGWNQPIASTTCGGGSVNIIQTEGPDAGSFVQIGMTEIEYMISDDCGNIAACSFTITVLPNNLPPPPNGEYCYAEGDNPWSHYIKRVRLSSINKFSGKDGYSDFTNERGYVTAGGDKYIILNPGNNGGDEYWTVYIDFNQDKDFTDAGEEVVRLHGFGEQGTSFDVPGNALGGDTRMRVVMQEDSYASSCGAFDNGEVEDYTITVTGASNTSAFSDDYLELSVGIHEPGTSTLQWVTNQEDNTTVGYQVERAGADGNFELLETIEVATPAAYAIVREYVDEQPLAGNNTYRVVQLRSDNTDLISDEAQIQFGIEGVLYPNPTSEGVFVDITNYEEAVQVEIYAADGKLVERQILQSSGSAYIDLSRFEDGLYLLKFNVTGKIWAERVILKKK